jgi:hypothetical protein
MAQKYLSELGCDWIIFLENPSIIPASEKKPIIFTNNQAVLKLIPDAILIDIDLSMTDDELAECLVWEACLRGLVPPGQPVLFSRFNGGLEDLVGKIKKVPEYAIRIRDEVVAGTVEFARTLSKEGVGAAFMIGDTRRVLALSEELYPFQIKRKPKIWERRYWEFFKKIFREFDGAFIINRKGEVVSIGRRLNPKARVKLENLGTRHHAVCAMTLDTRATGVAVSEEDRRIRIFAEGKMVCTIGPFKN